MELKQITIGNGSYAICVGEHNYIVTHNDFVHEVMPKSMKASIAISGWQFKDYSLKRLLAKTKPIKSMKEWAHYWGVKDRVYHNYIVLLRSMKYEGIDVISMPEWGR